MRQSEYKIEKKQYVAKALRVTVGLQRARRDIPGPQVRSDIFPPFAPYGRQNPSHTRRIRKEYKNVLYDWLFLT